MYFSAERKYDSTNKITTRARDEMGIFNFKMGVNGQEVIVQTRDAVEEIERETIVNALHNNNGSRVKAAKALGISRTSLYEKMEKHNIAVE